VVYAHALCRFCSFGVADAEGHPLPRMRVLLHVREWPERQYSSGVDLVLARLTAHGLRRQELHQWDAAPSECAQTLS